MTIGEPRSFAPRRDQGASTGVKIQKVNEDRPSLRAIARAHNQTHDCIEDGFAKTHARAEEIHAEVARVGAALAGLKDELGLTGKKKKPVGLASNWQSFRRTVAATTSSIVAVALVYKLAVLAWPGLWEVLKALGGAAMHGLF